MKKLLLILLLLLIPCIAFSQLFDIGGEFGFGYLTEWECYIAEVNVAFFVNPNGLINAVMYGGVETLMDTAGKTFSFYPYLDRYSIGTTVNFSVFYVDFTHYCILPVWSNWNQFTEKAYIENCTKITTGIRWNMPYKVNRRGR